MINYLKPMFCFLDDGQWGCGCNQWLVLVFVCLAIGVCGIVIVSVLQSLNYDPVYSVGHMLELIIKLFCLSFNCSYFFK